MFLTSEVSTDASSVVAFRDMAQNQTTAFQWRNSDSTHIYSQTYTSPSRNFKSLLAGCFLLHVFRRMIAAAESRIAISVPASSLDRENIIFRVVPSKQKTSCSHTERSGANHPNDRDPSGTNTGRSLTPQVRTHAQPGSARLGESCSS